MAYHSQTPILLSCCPQVTLLVQNLYASSHLPCVLPSQADDKVAADAARQLKMWRLRAPALTPSLGDRARLLPTGQMLQPSQVAACVGALGMLNVQVWGSNKGAGSSMCGRAGHAERA